MGTFGTWSLERPSGEIMGQANQDYFLDADGNVTTDEQEAATLLIRKGQDVSKDMADKYGDALSGKVARQSVADEADAEDAPDEKAATKSANKKASPSKNKGAK
jgi:hypothetical protein